MAKKVIQKHHISYDPETVVHIYKVEHWLLTQLQRRKNISWGFVIALKNWIVLHSLGAKDLTGEYEQNRKSKSKTKEQK